jgi:hypothetical protein
MAQTIDEFKQFHRETLKGVMQETNRLYAEWKRAKAGGVEDSRRREDEHRRHLRDSADGLTFDDF